MHAMLGIGTDTAQTIRVIVAYLLRALPEITVAWGPCSAVAPDSRHSDGQLRLMHCCMQARIACTSMSIAANRVLSMYVVVPDLVIHMAIESREVDSAIELVRRLDSRDKLRVPQLLCGNLLHGCQTGMSRSSPACRC